MTALRSARAPWEHVETTVLRALTEHPELGQFDRFNLLTGRPASDVLRSWMIGWVHNDRQLEALTPTSVPQLRRIHVQLAESVLEQLPPVLGPRLHQVRQSNPGAGAEETLDRALAQAIRDLRVVLNRQTFEYLRWRAKRSVLAELGPMDSTPGCLPH